MTIQLGIGIPSYGSKLDVGHAAMWLGLGAALFEARDKIALRWMAEYHINGIDLCRNTIVYDAMQAGCDWVLMVDADTFHRSVDNDGLCDAIGDAGADIGQMIRDADRGQVALASGEGYTLREIPMPPNTNGVGLVGAPVRGRGLGDPGVCVRGLGLEPLSIEDLRGEVRPVGRIGGAFIAVHCNWLRCYWPTGPWFVMEHDYRGRPGNMRGEDYFFCDGIRQRGGVVLCDGRFEPRHVDRRRIVGQP